MNDRTTRFLPGDGVALVSSRTLAVVSCPVPAATELVSRDADVSDIIDAVPATVDLAVVRLEADDALAAVRGCAHVEFVADLPRRLDGGADPVALRTTLPLEGVRSVRVGFGESAGVTDSAFALVAGVVPAVALERDTGPAITIAARSEDDPFGAMFGHTRARTVESAAVRDGAEPPGADPPVGVLLFSTGERVVVDQPVLLGRNPQPGTNDGVDVPKLVRVPGAGVSRRHAAITIDRWSAQIDDLGSANGTRVTLPGRSPRSVAPGEPVDLVAGARVDLGGEVSFVVEEVA